MKMDANDPRWTAYALGELEDEKERAELESILEQSEEMRLLVEDIRQTAGWLNEGLKDESSFELTQAQRERIASQSVERKAWFRLKPAWALATVAAVFALGLSFWMYELEIEKKKVDSQVAQVVNRPESSAVLDSVSQVEAGRQAEVKTKDLSSTMVESAERESVPRDASVPRIDGSVSAAREKASAALEKYEDLSAETSETTRKEAASAQGAATGKNPVVVLPAASNNENKPADVMSGTLAGAGHEPAGISRQKVEVIRGADKESQSFAGAAPDSLNVERDGITVRDARNGSGTAPLFSSAGSATSSYVPPPPAQRVVSVAERSRGIPSPAVPRRPREDGGIYPPYPPSQANFNTEGYASILDNPFLEVVQNPLSTFSIDVDTASYANVRRFLESGQWPPRDAVRIEELVNYFDYDYKGPGREGPFAAHFEMTEAPWNPEHRLLRIGLKAKEIESRERPKTNLVFLIDVSGSMSAYNKLPLVQEAMHLLVDRLTGNDHVSIVTYAGSTRVELPSTPGDEKWSIHRAIDRLRSGGSTAGASGIQLAYETARQNFIRGGANRVILATDGDFNVGITNHGDLARFIEEKADSGVFLSALGFGMGNYKDDTLELLANRGRGNYAYIDTIDEARKVLVDEIDATLVSVAKDVKIQVEFNPGQVAGYRLVGYEDRVMPKEDFNDDARKAGVIGAGHAVTALYEIVPAGRPVPSSGVDPLKYQKPVETTRSTSSREVATVKIRYKEPEGEESRLMEFAVEDSGKKFDKASDDFKFAASVAAFGMVLRDSPYKGSATLEDALAWAKEGRGKDLHGYRDEFIRLLHRAISIER